jgi:hypothetical protein
MANSNKTALFKYIRETGNIKKSCALSGFDRNLFYRLFRNDRFFRERANREKARYILKS